MTRLRVYELEYENDSYGRAYALVAARNRRSALSVVEKANKSGQLKELAKHGYSIGYTSGKWIVLERMENIEYTGRVAAAVAYYEYFE